MAGLGIFCVSMVSDYDTDQFSMKFKQPRHCFSECTISSQVRLKISTSGLYTIQPVHNRFNVTITFFDNLFYHF